MFWLLLALTWNHSLKQTHRARLEGWSPYFVCRNPEFSPRYCIIHQIPWEQFLTQLDVAPKPQKKANNPPYTANGRNYKFVCKELLFVSFEGPFVYVSFFNFVNTAVIFLSALPYFKKINYLQAGPREIAQL